MIIFLICSLSNNKLIEIVVTIKKRLMWEFLKIFLTSVSQNQINRMNNRHHLCNKRTHDIYLFFEFKYFIFSELLEQKSEELITCSSRHATILDLKKRKETESQNLYKYLWTFPTQQ